MKDGHFVMNLSGYSAVSSHLPILLIFSDYILYWVLIDIPTSPVVVFLWLIVPHVPV